jgi:hypothetical protein
MSYDIGTTVRVPIDVKDDAGAPIAAVVAFTVTRPDGTVFPLGAVVNPSVGSYYVDVIPDGTAYGIWSWSATVGGTVAQTVYTGQFFVRSPGPRIVSLAEVKRHLNKSPGVTTDDEELRDWIDAAQIVVEGIVGPVMRRTVVETYYPRGEMIVLRTAPVHAVTSVVEEWGPDDVRTLASQPAAPGPYGDDDYSTDTTMRYLFRRSGGWPRTFGPKVTVTYGVGPAVPAQNVRLATMELITHMWRGSQLASGTTRPRQDAPDPISLAYAVPNRVRELLGRRRGPRLGV